MLVEEVRRQRVLLPAPRVLELIVHHARARGERITHRALTVDLTAAQSAALDGLLGSSGGHSRMAWLRQASSSRASRNLPGLIERVRAVRALGVDRDREGAVPTPAFDTLAGKGLRMTAQHLRDLAQPRRAATMAAAVIRLETELADAALLMFDKLMGGLARKSERRTMETAAGALRDAQGHPRVMSWISESRRSRRPVLDRLVAPAPGRRHAPAPRRRGPSGRAGLKAGNRQPRPAGLGSERSRSARRRSDPSAACARGATATGRSGC